MEHEPRLEIKEEMFRIIIKPLLKNKRVSEPEYWLNFGFTGWSLGIDNEDIKLVLLIEKMCEKIFEVDEEKLRMTFADILSKQHETSVRAEQAYQNSYLEDAKDIENMFAEKLKLYKMHFENQFRLWATIPFLFLNLKDTKIVNFADVGASEKYQAIKNSKIFMTMADISDLTQGFDNQIRNSGDGHDRWEIDDDSHLILNVVDPVTGKLKKEMVLTMDDLEKLLKKCRKTLWILQVGTLIFIENNPDFIKKVKITKEIKIKEIERSAINFAAGRLLKVNEFSLDKKSKKLSLALQYVPQENSGHGKELFTSYACYDIIDRKIKVRFEFNMLDVIRKTLSHFDNYDEWHVSVKMIDENGVIIGNLEYEPEEIKKLFTDDEQSIPIPSKGVIPDKEIELILPIKVPYGTRDIASKIIDSLDLNNIDDNNAKSI